jgi:hypothetical protein
MPYQFQWEQNGVVINLSSELSLKVINSADTEFYNNPKSEIAKYVIYDLSLIETIDFDVQFMRFISIRDKLASLRMPNIKMGFVVRDEKTAHLCQEYINYSLAGGSPWEFNVSESIETIREWIAS